MDVSFPLPSKHVKYSITVLSDLLDYDACSSVLYEMCKMFSVNVCQHKHLINMNILELEFNICTYNGKKNLVLHLCEVK